ncbi:uncharacterized protein LOC119096076 [Pollicipes pollicipes]|uniref:uncharacterized protein LOC119096076 n=1 Tax=Pollicipes pollicipes TaxID=41117 RepID=UPI0018855C70|nr:uncharacterized protein LOC119096076 [Pollicipes pollicipes]
MFSTLVSVGDTVQLGEELHLRSIIRSGDGWRYSKLTDVLVERVSVDGSRLPTDTAPLVFDDGCRNERFSGMTSGDQIRVSAQVTGCVEAIDCAPTACPDRGRGYGRRRRRALNQPDHNTTNWSRDVAFRVALPLPSTEGVQSAREPGTTLGTTSGCPAYLLGSLVAALACCLLLLACAVCVLNVTRSHLKSVSGTTELQPKSNFKNCCGSAGARKHEYEMPPKDDSPPTVWLQAAHPSWDHLPTSGAWKAPRARCTVRQMKRRRAPMRRSYSAGNVRCDCTAPEMDVSSRGSNVSIVHVTGGETFDADLSSLCDVEPTVI